MTIQRYLTVAVLLLVFSPAMAEVEETQGAEVRSDEELERFLLEGKIIEAKSLGEGVTRPMKVTLEMNGSTMRAAFKTVDIQERGVTRFDGAPPEFNFSDRYQYERAAYLLDRHLGMNMAPVTVLRSWSGKRGAMIEWIENAIDEGDRLKEKRVAPDPVHLKYQRSVMDLFDALISNADRNTGNQLITTDDWKLHLIDHSRTFRQIKKLPDRFLGQPVSLPRSLLERLEALEEKSLRELLKGVASRSQVRALLARRDKILEKIEADRKQYGDRMIFQD